jgi:tetratricopeptide (TPR) repeat protein
LAGAPEARVRAAREEAEAELDPAAHGAALLELAQALRARPGLGVRLQEAIDTARQAVRALEGTDVHTLAAARSTLAHLLVEHGHPSSLDEALDQVVDASRELGGAGDAIAAASLLNDQAEVWLKLGDPVRATHLLRSAEVAMEGRDDPASVVERAETAHLLARLPLYTPARPGLAHDALERSLEHLRTAGDAYQQLGWADRLAHVLDTEGRLLARLGRIEPAATSLQRAAEVYRQLGDGLGLARATEGLASVWAAAGQVRRASALLEQSLVLNAAARSPAGLAFVRRAAEGLPEGPETERLFARLQEAERVLGRVELPPTPA